LRALNFDYGQGMTYINSLVDLIRKLSLIDYSGHKRFSETSDLHLRICINFEDPESTSPKRLVLDRLNYSFNYINFLIKFSHPNTLYKHPPHKLNLIDL
jgi:hypothetical protein